MLNAIGYVPFWPIDGHVEGFADRTNIQTEITVECVEWFRAAQTIEMIKSTQKQFLKNH